MNEFLDILLDSPTLEELILINAGPIDKSGQVLRTVSLSSLRKLEIGERDETFTSQLLSALVLAACTQICIWDHGFLFAEGVLPILFNEGSRQRHTFSTITKLRILYLPDGWVMHVIGGMMTLAYAFDTLDSLPHFKAFPALEEILLDTPDASVEDYVEMFKDHPPIHTLTLCDASLPFIARAVDILHGNDSLDDDFIPESFWTGYPSARMPGATTYKQELILRLQA